MKIQNALSLSLLVLSSHAFAVPTKDELKEMFKTDYNGAFEDSERLTRIKYRGKPGALQKLSSCTGDDFATIMERFESQAKRQEPIAQATAVTAAQVAGTCATMDIKDFGKTNYTEYALQAGVALSRAWIYDSQGLAGTTPERAVGYLEYAESEGRTEGAALLAQLRGKMNPVASIDTAKPDFSMTAEKAVADYDGNLMFFRKTYARKVLRITGTASSINESGNIVYIRLDGAPKKDPNLKRFQDEVECRISNKEAKEKALSVRKGQKLVVQGVFLVDDSLRGTALGGVDLSGCIIQ